MHRTLCAPSHLFSESGKACGWRGLQHLNPPTDPSTATPAPTRHNCTSANLHAMSPSLVNRRTSCVAGMPRAWHLNSPCIPGWDYSPRAGQSRTAYDMTAGYGLESKGLPFLVPHVRSMGRLQVSSSALIFYRCEDSLHGFVWGESMLGAWFGMKLGSCFWHLKL